MSKVSNKDGRQLNQLKRVSMKINYAMTLTLALCFWAGAAGAFDGESIRFSNPTDPRYAVDITFKGKVFKPPIDVLDRKTIEKNLEYQRFKGFFNQVYERNRQGDTASVLSIWHPQDRDAIQAAMDDVSLKKNKEQFKAMTSMRLRMIVQFGDYYICLVETTIAGQAPLVMKYPVTQYKGELVLTNGLNGDYFYELISHYMDQTNFGALLGQQR